MSFKPREEANKSPDCMGDIYEFVKLNIDDFVKYIDDIIVKNDGFVFHRNSGPVEMFLNETRPDHHWSVVPSRIYFTSNDPYDPEDIDSETGRVPLEKMHPNKFSETQKWVAKIEDWVMNHAEPTMTPNVIREMIKKATGK